MPLGQRGVVMRAELSNRGAHAVSFTLEVLPQVRNYAAVNCSPQQWRFPSNEAQHCWNWFAPRTFANESAAFSATFDPKRRLAVFYDHTTGADGAPPAVTAIAFAGEWGALKFNVSSQRGRPLVASFSVPPKAQRDAAAMEQPMTVGLALAVGVVSELPAPPPRGRCPLLLPPVTSASAWAWAVGEAQAESDTASPPARRKSPPV